MASTLLQLVNRLFNLSRDEQITTIPAADVRTETAIGLLNQAKDMILGGYDWDFNHRHDGAIEFLAPVTTSLISRGVPGAIFVTPLLGAWPGVPKIVITGSSVTYRQLAYQVRTFDQLTIPGSTVVTLHAPIPEPIFANQTCTIFFHEVALPTNVARPTSIRDEEHPLQLYFEDNELQFDSFEPRPQDSLGRPEFAMCAGIATNAFDSTVPNAVGHTGVRLLVWPVPDARTMLFYSYVQRHLDLAMDADQWIGAAPEVETLIVQGAYELSLRSSVEQDATRSAVFSAALRREIANVHSRHKPDPLRRRIPRPFGSRPWRDPYRRWASRTVPTP